MHKNKLIIFLIGFIIVSAQASNKIPGALIELMEQDSTQKFNGYFFMGLPKDQTRLNDLLHLAAQHNATKIAKLLLGSNADINAKDGFGDTSLMTAARLGNLEIVKLLVERGADLTLENSNAETALTIAQDAAIHKEREKDLAVKALKPKFKKQLDKINDVISYLKKKEKK